MNSLILPSIFLHTLVLVFQYLLIYQIIFTNHYIIMVLPLFCLKIYLLFPLFFVSVMLL